MTRTTGIGGRVMGVVHQDTRRSLVEALPGLVAIGVPRSCRGLSRPAQIALGGLAAFTAWSFVSISWADAPGPAWDAANRALLYLILFTLFSRSARGRLTRRLLLGSWTLAMIALAVVVLLKLPAVLNADVTLFRPGLEQ